MENEPLFSFYDPLSAFTAPDQHYWNIYSSIMLDSSIEGYTDKKESIVRELNLVSAFDYEDAHIRKLNDSLYISPIYLNVFLKSGKDGGREIENIFPKMIDTLRKVKSTQNISSIYHNDWYVHQIDIDVKEPFSMLLMGTEKEIENRMPDLKGRPDTDDMHLLIKHSEARKRLVHAAEIIEKRPRKSLHILKNIISVLDLLNEFDERSLIRIPLENINNISRVYSGRKIRISDAVKALKKLDNDEILDFLDYF